MKRSEINALVREASERFRQEGWALPPEPKWDVTDFGLGNVARYGLVLINLADEPEYCEKLMFAKRGMVTPKHSHGLKKEDIICRSGRLRIRVWPGKVPVKRNGIRVELKDEAELVLEPGERVTLSPGTDHEFEPVSEDCIIGEVSTANDDAHDNFFTDPVVGRYPEVTEDEPPLVKLISD